MAEKVASMVLTVKDLASPQFQKMTKNINGVERGVNKLNSTMRGAARVALGMAGFYGIQSAIEGMTRATIGFSAEWERSEIGFATMTGSLDQAKKTMNDLAEMSMKLPVPIEEAQTAAKKLLAYGFEAETIPRVIKDVADASAGLGLSMADGVGRVTLALGQILAKGKVAGQEMRQLAEAGIPAWQFLSEYLGKTTAETMKLSEQGLIPAKEAIEAILVGMEGRFGGMLGVLTKTFYGQIQLIKSNLMMLGKEAFAPAFDYLNEEVLPSVLNKIKDVSEAVNSGGIGAGLAEIFPESLINTFKWLKGNLGTIEVGLKSMFAAFMTFNIAHWADEFVRAIRRIKLSLGLTSPQLLALMASMTALTAAYQTWKNAQLDVTNKTVEELLVLGQKREELQKQYESYNKSSRSAQSHLAKLEKEIGLIDQQISKLTQANKIRKSEADALKALSDYQERYNKALSESNGAVDTNPKAEKPMKWMFENSFISFKEYETYLRDILAANDRFTEPWRNAWDEIQRITEAAGKKASDAVKTTTKKLKDALEEGKKILQEQESWLSSVQSDVDALWSKRAKENSVGLLPDDTYFAMIISQLQKGVDDYDTMLDRMSEANSLAMDKFHEAFDPMIEKVKDGELEYSVLRQKVLEWLEPLKDLLPLVNSQTIEHIEALKNAQDATEELEQRQEEWLKDFKDGIVDCIVEGNSFKDLLQDILRDMSKFFIKRMLFGGEGFEGLLGGLFSAKGNAFDSGQVVPFASGGVLTKPAAFPLGIAGEAGPEAIMPLQRGSDGKLGVGANGSGNTTITMNINAVDGQSVVRMLEGNKATIESLVVRSISGNGSIRKAIKGYV